MELNIIDGQLSAKNLPVAIILSQFNFLVTEKLLHGAIHAFCQCGGNKKELVVAQVPGALELPLACQHAAETKQFSALAVLGTVIQGQTTHFDHVCTESIKGIVAVGLKYHLPIGMGVLTTENLEQALDRAGGKAGNKGAEAMQAAIQMAQLLKQNWNTNVLGDVGN